MRTIVLLPGLDGTGALFEPVIAALSRTYNIYSARYPADRFLSYTELLACVNDIIPSDPFILVGESFSSPLAVKFAACHPTNLVGLIICAGFVTNPLRKWSFGIRVLANPLLLRIPLPDMVMEKFIVGRRAPAALKVAVRRALSLVHPNVLAQRIHAVLECDTREALKRIKVPIMYIQGENDRLVQAECFQEIQGLRPDTVLASISAPHLVLQREPQKAAAVISKFIDSLSAHS
ncbi:MAG: alpha/beta fold hydrolase [Terriglobales bacterium]